MIDNDSSRECDTVKQEGNELFQQKQYLKAVDKYTAVLDNFELDDKTKAIILSNRAQCYLNTSPPNYLRAAEDSKESLSLDSNSMKGLYRLGTALKGLQQYEEAIYVAEEALNIYPSNNQFIKLKRDCIKEADQVSSPKNEEEQRVLECLQVLVNSFRSIDNPIRAEALSEGMLRSLLEGNGFSTLINTIISGMETPLLKTPVSLYEVMQSSVFLSILHRNFSKIMKNASSIFQSVLSRGLQQNQIMDRETRSGVILQITQEALAREIINLLPKYISELMIESLPRQSHDSSINDRTDSSLSHKCCYLSPRSIIPKSQSAWEAMNIDTLQQNVDNADAGEIVAIQIVGSIKDMLEGMESVFKEELNQLQMLTMQHNYQEGCKLGNQIMKKIISNQSKGKKESKELSISALLTTACAISSGDFPLACSSSKQSILSKPSDFPPTCLAYCWYLRALAFAGLDCIYLTNLHIKRSLKIFILPGALEIEKTLQKFEILSNRNTRSIDQLILTGLQHSIKISKVFANWSSSRCLRFGITEEKDFITLLTHEREVCIGSSSEALDADEQITHGGQAEDYDNLNSMLSQFRKNNEDELRDLHLAVREFRGAQVLFMEHLFLSAEVKYIIVILILGSQHTKYSEYCDKLVSTALLNIATCRIRRGFKESNEPFACKYLDWRALRVGSPQQLIDLTNEIYQIDYFSTARSVLWYEHIRQFDFAIEGIMKLKGLPCGDPGIVFYDDLQIESRIDDSTSFKDKVALDLNYRERRNIFARSVYGGNA